MMEKLIRYTLTIFCFLIVESIAAQLTVTLVLNGQPPSYMSDWGNGRAGQIIVNNTLVPQQRLEVKIATTLANENGDVIATSNNASAQIISINIGANVIGLDRVIQLENLSFVGKFNSLATSGKLLPGLYSLNVTLLDARSLQPLSKITTKMFSQVNYQLPFLLFPADEAELDVNIAQSIIIFRWSSLVPMPRDVPTYRLQVFEILSNQTPMQALRSNQPILLADVLASTQYIWRPQMYMKDSLHQNFIWTIQTVDFKGVPFNTSSDNNTSTSEPRVFSIVNKMKIKSN
jgi:hypothetical protein